MPIMMLAAAQVATSTVPGAAPDATVRQIIQDCDAHKFETIVSAEVDGILKSSKVKLCGVRGQTDAEWLRTLEDSAAKVAINDKMAKPMRDAMVVALNNEVSRLKIAGALPGTVPGVAPPAGVASNSTFTLKPRSPIAPPPPGQGGSQGMKGYAALPPLPPPLKPGEAGASGFVAPPPIVRPDLRFQCFSTDSIAEGPCDVLDRYSTVVVAARSPVKDGTTINFAVDGEERTEVDIGGMRKGQVRRIAIPASVCRGVSSARLELRTMVLPDETKFGPQRAATDGPFILHCQ